MSTHEVLIYQVNKLDPWPASDFLEEIHIEDYTCAVRKGDYKVGDLIVYIEPDYVVPDTPEYSFLKGHRRIKVKKLRGKYSMGLIVPAPSGTQVGDNVMEQMGIIRWEPELHTSKGSSRPSGCGIPSGQQAEPPSGIFPRYDVENWRKYGKHHLVPGEEVFITEKIHGASGRCVYQGDRLHVGSHNTWKKPGGMKNKQFQAKKAELQFLRESGEEVDFNELQHLSMWWQVVEENPWMEIFCRVYMGIAPYWEVYGQVQDMKYETTPEDPYCLAVFDLWDSINHCWLEVDDPRWQDIPLQNRVPLLYRGPYDSDMIEQLAEGQSTIAFHIREGCVVKTVPERTIDRFGRGQFKCVGLGYLERN